jgi:NAD(P)H-dependent FMN reductase
MTSPNQARGGKVTAVTAISVIIGSTREGRFSEKPARWIFQHLKNRSGVDGRLLDLQDGGTP